MKRYAYVYYRVFDLLGLTGNYDLPWGASHALSLFISLLVFNVTLRVQDNLDYTLVAICGVIMFLMLHVVHYFIFLKEDKYESIIGFFSNESKSSRAAGRFVTITLMGAIIYLSF